MALLERIKTIIGISGGNEDAALNFLIEDCKAFAMEYCNLEAYSDKLDNVVTRMVLERRNQTGNEGISGVSYAGDSETYLTDYSEPIYKALRKHRRLKTL